MSIGDVFDDMAYGFNYLSPLRTNYSFRGTIIDTDKYDIVPKRSYLEEEISRKEEELKRIEEVYKINLKQKQDEIEDLKNKKKELTIKSG